MHQFAVKLITYRNTKDCTYTSLVSDFNHRITHIVNSMQLDHSLTPPSLFEKMASLLFANLDRYESLVTCKLTKLPASWITAEPRNSCKERNKQYQISRSPVSCEFLLLYYSRLRTIKTQSGIARQEYTRNELVAETLTGKIWKVLECQGFTSISTLSATKFFDLATLDNHCKG